MVTMAILGFRFAVLGVKIAKTVLVKRDSMCQALHRGVEEAGVPVVGHRKGDPVTGIGCPLH